MRHPILPRTFSYSVAMEPIRVRGPLRRNCVRHVRACSAHWAYAATAHSSFDAALENIFACLNRICTRAELDLSAAALAQILKALVEGI